MSGTSRLTQAAPLRYTVPHPPIRGPSPDGTHRPRLARRRRRCPRHTPVVFPIAALEQHGRHMPVFTDSLLLGEVVRRVKLTPVAGEVPVRPAAVARQLAPPPRLPRHALGVRRASTSTCSRTSRACFIAHGFTRIVFVNGHGGNIVPEPAGALRAEAGAPRTAANCCLLVAHLLGRGRRPVEDRSPASCRSRWATPASGRRR